MRKAQKKSITVVNMGRNKTVDKYSGCIRGKGGAETINVVKAKTCRPGDITDVGLK